MTDTPPHTRLILASDDLLEVWGTRTNRGDRITAEWGEPTPEGWYVPVFTSHSDDNLIAKERAKIKAAVKKEKRKEPWPEFGTPSGHEQTARDAWNAALLRVLAILDGEV